MKRVLLCWSFFGFFVLIMPGTAFSLHLVKFWCGACHPDGQPTKQCLDCHNNLTGGDYTVYSAPGKVNYHSSTVIGSDKYDTWARDCMDCHSHNQPNGFDGEDGGVGVKDQAHVLVDLDVANPVNYVVDEVTFDITSATVNYPEWNDPYTWGNKSGKERGLLFIYYERPLSKNHFKGKYRFRPVISANATSITIWSSGAIGFDFPEPLHAQLIYGDFIRDSINDNPVAFISPATMAVDEANDGNGFDETPDGVCQVCHTRTLHWQNSGSLANHFSGWNCTLCHPHQEGFKADPPTLVRCEDLAPVPERDCSGTLGGDKVLDNCGTCDNDPSNDCVMDCNGVWGGKGVLDACGVCDGDSTQYPDGSPCDLADRSGTVTVSPLMWQQATADVNTNGVWDDGDKLYFYLAVDYCETLQFAGYTDWRLPSRDELKGLVLCVDNTGTTTTETPMDNGQSCGGEYVKPTIDQSLFDCAPRTYWLDSGSSKFWFTSFATGRTWTTRNNPYYVRCVRDVQ